MNIDEIETFVAIAERGGFTSRAMRTVIPIVAIHRRNGYLSPAAATLLALLTRGAASAR
jgi:hypothetical protein